MDDYWDHLLERVSGHSEYFKGMIAMIPPQLVSSSQTQTSFNKKSPIRPSPKVLRAQQKENKLKKFDPRHQSDESSDDEEEGVEGKVDEENDFKVEIIPGFSNNVILDNQELNKRFQERLASLRNKRKAPDEPENQEHARKRQKIEVRRIEKKEKKKRRDNSKQKSGPSVPKEGLSRHLQETKRKNPESPDLKSIEFASFDMSSGAPVPLYLQKRNKRPSNAVLLQKAEEQREKLKALEGTEEGKKIASEAAWESMFKKAQGEKVKDDITKLKKTLKREQAQKKKSKKDWAQRLGDQKKSQREAQQKRQKNIDARKQQKKDRKMGIKPSRPGFEGKKRQYINKK